METGDIQDERFQKVGSSLGIPMRSIAIQRGVYVGATGFKETSMRGTKSEALLSLHTKHVPQQENLITPGCRVP